MNRGQRYSTLGFAPICSNSSVNAGYQGSAIGIRLSMWRSSEVHVDVHVHIVDHICVGRLVLGGRVIPATLVGKLFCVSLQLGLFEVLRCEFLFRCVGSGFYESMSRRRTIRAVNAPASSSAHRSMA